MNKLWLLKKACIDMNNYTSIFTFFYNDIIKEILKKEICNNI